MFTVLDEAEQHAGDVVHLQVGAARNGRVAFRGNFKAGKAYAFAHGILDLSRLQDGFELCLRYWSHGAFKLVID